MSIETHALANSLINAIGWALIHFVWQGTLIASIAVSLLFICRHARAQTRYLIACLSLLICFVVPIWNVIQTWQLRIDSPDNLASGTQHVKFASESGLHNMQSWLQINISTIVFCWALVVVLLSLRLQLGLWWLSTYRDGRRGINHLYWQQQVNHLARKFALGNRVILRVVQDIRSPITIGCFRPMILVPASLITGMAPAHLEALLAHEMAHIARYDYLVNFIQNVIEVFLFFHPAVWWISKYIRNERELIADDLAASILGEPRRLALALQELEFIQFTTPQLAQAAHGGNLMSRIKRLVRPEVQSTNWKTAVSAVGIATVCIGLAANAAIPNLPNLSTINQPAPEVLISNAELNNATVLELPIADQTGSAMPLVSEKPTIDGKAEVRKQAKSQAQNSTVIAARIDFAQAGCAPEYPREALQSESQGTSRFSILVSDKGRIQNVSVEKSSGHVLLDDAVKNQLLLGKCVGKPKMLNGKPQSSTIMVDYVWKLD